MQKTLREEKFTECLQWTAQFRFNLFQGSIRAKTRGFTIRKSHISIGYPRKPIVIYQGHILSVILVNAFISIKKDPIIV
jgi:hypothetical protein